MRLTIALQVAMVDGGEATSSEDGPGAARVMIYLAMTVAGLWVGVVVAVLNDLSAGRTAPHAEAEDR